MNRSPRSLRGRRAQPREITRITAHTLGELLVTAGVVVLLFVTYELWITNVFGHERQAQATAALDRLWAGQPDVVSRVAGTEVATAAGPARTPSERQLTYDTSPGTGFAKLYIPAFGPDFAFTVVEGTTQQDLYSGPGHYTNTQYPGQAGNFALAGHRVNKGAPFDDLGLLDSCDAIVIETVDSWYVYRVLPMRDETAGWDYTPHAHCAGVAPSTGAYARVYGREITTPTDGAQLDPVPHSGSAVVPAGAERLITLTTCEPKFSDRQRMIIHGIEVASYPRANRFLPPEMKETD